MKIIYGVSVQDFSTAYGLSFFSSNSCISVAPNDLSCHFQLRQNQEIWVVFHAFNKYLK